MTPAEFKAARLQLGLTAKQLAQCLELHGPRAVYKYERAEVPIQRPLALLLSLSLTEAKVREALLQPLAAPPPPPPAPSKRAPRRPASRSPGAAPASTDTPA